MLAEVLGGNVLLGFIAAVSFATILAVVAGLTLSGAAALSHDLWVNVVRGGSADETEQLKVARGATMFLGALAIVLGIVFKGQNVAYMVGLAFAIAASGNFPALLMSILWRRFTTNGAVASMVTGTLTSLFLIYLSPTIQIDLLKHTEAIFPLKNPGLITIPLSFAVGIIVSLLKSDRQAYAKFAEVEQLIHISDLQFPSTLPAKDIDVEL
jgi:cation/acetate symporter